MSLDLFLVACSLLVWGAGEGMFLFFQPLYLQELGAGPLDIGAILGVLGIVMAVVHIPAGLLSDRFGRRPVLRIAWITGTIAAWSMALASTLPVFVYGLLLYGMTSFVAAPLNSYISSARSRWSTGRTITLILAFFNMGAVAGPFVGGIIGERAGLRTVYLVAASLFILSTVLIFFIGPQRIETRPVRGAVHGSVLNVRLVSFLGVVFLAMFATYLPQPLSSYLLQNERGLSLLQIGQLGALSSLGVVALNLTLGQINPRLGFLLGQASVAAFAFLLWRGTGLAWYAAGYFLLGGYRTTRSLAAAQTRELVLPANMGLVYGMTETVSGAAAILAAPLAGYLYQVEPLLIYSASLGLVGISLVAAVFFLNASKIKAPSLLTGSATNKPAEGSYLYDKPPVGDERR